MENGTKFYDTVIVDPSLPPVKIINDLRGEMLDTFIRDAVLASITSSGRSQGLGSFLIGIGGVVPSLFADSWNPCIKYLFLVVLVIIGLTLVLHPLKEENREKLSTRIVNMIDADISSFLNYDKRAQKYLEEQKDKVTKASKDMDKKIEEMHGAKDDMLNKFEELQNRISGKKH